MNVRDVAEIVGIGPVHKKPEINCTMDVVIADHRRNDFRTVCPFSSAIDARLRRRINIRVEKAVVKIRRREHLSAGMHNESSSFTNRARIAQHFSTACMMAGSLKISKSYRLGDANRSQALWEATAGPTKENEHKRARRAHNGVCAPQRFGADCVP